MITKTGFSMAGCDGTEFNLMEMQLKKGFDEAFYEAPYMWALINEKEMSIYTYCEGDITLEICQDKKEFKEKLARCYDFYKNNYSEEQAQGFNKVRLALKEHFDKVTEKIKDE